MCKVGSALIVLHPAAYRPFAMQLCLGLEEILLSKCLVAAMRQIKLLGLA